MRSDPRNIGVILALYMGYVGGILGLYRGLDRGF